MKRRKWSDAELEELLKRMPKMIDTRSKIEIYQNISVRTSKRSKRLFVMPMVATAAALLLFFILAPSLLNWQASEEKSMGDVQNRLMPEQKEEKSSIKSNEALDKSAEESEESIGISSYNANNDQNKFKTIPAEDYSTAVYEDEINDMEVLIYDIPDENVQTLIPISLLVMKQENKTKFDLFKENMKNLREEDWGLADYYPLNAELTFDEETHILTVDVHAHHTYSESSATELMLKHVLSDVMIEFNIEKTELMNEGKTGIDFAHLGFQEEFKRDEERSHFAYYFYYPNATKTKPYIVPYGEKLGSINEAFSAMKENMKEANLVASIPADLNFDAYEDREKQVLTLTFSNDSKIYDDQPSTNTIEAILLTAKEFDFQAVKLENTNIEKVGRFNLSETLQVPVAANKQILH